MKCISDSRNRRFRQPPTFLAGAWLAVLVAVSAAAQPQVVDLRYQWATEVGGPWQDVPASALQMASDGSARLMSEEPGRLFRLQVGEAGRENSLPIVPFEELTEVVRKVAMEHLASFATQEEESGEAGAWKNVQLAPFAVVLGTGWGEPGEARYAEIKVVAGPDEVVEPKPDFLPDNSVVRPDRNRGYLIVSLDRSDFPILQWATEGPTPSEEMLRLASARPGTRIARIVRFGPTLLVGEDEEGRPVANLGTEPFKVLPDALDGLKDPMVGEFDTEDETRQDPMPQVKFYLGAYESYEEMKQDLRENAFHEAQRRQRQRLADYVWDAVEGRAPELLSVGVGETRTFFEDRVFSRFEAQWEEPDDRPLARIAVLPRGGIQITGASPGSTLVSLYDSEGIWRYGLAVSDPGQVRRQDVRPMSTVVRDVAKTWYAGTWANQKRYHQAEHPDWCRKVGCGPVALAMLFGWWDHQGVPSAFYRQTGTVSQQRASLRTADAPETVTTLMHPSYYHYLHDLCDVICFGAFSDSGATWPGDLIEAVHGYLAALGPRWFLLGGLGVTEPLIGYKTSWAWDAFGDDWNTSGSRVAEGIKNGRPGIVGLGVLWHYVVAYGYYRREIYLEVNGKKEYTYAIDRHFRCNEGWGKKDPAWYSAYEVFLGLQANLWQKTLPPAP